MTLLVLIFLLWLTAAALAFPHNRATAASAGVTFIVTKTADTNDGVCSSDCSLREAIVAANAVVGADTIVVPAGTYNLTRVGRGEDAAATGDLDITGDVTITGAGAASTIIDGQYSDRVFHIIGAWTVAISGVTVRNGIVSGAKGGGILNNGTLTLSGSTVTSSGTDTGAAGGGVANLGTLTVSNSTVSANQSTFGGGIYSEGSGVAVTVVNSTVSGNQAGYGGGVYNKYGTFSVTSSTVFNNTADTAGGGINNYVGGTVELVGSVVSSNMAAQMGGGVNVERGQLKVTRSAVISNTVMNLSDVYGAGIYNQSTATLNLSDSTVGGNLALATNSCSIFGGCTTNYRSHGGGIANTGTLTVLNSTISGSAALYVCGFLPCTGFGAEIWNTSSASLKNTIVGSLVGADNCYSTVALVSAGHNIDTGTLCNLTDSTDQSSTNPLMEALQSDGGAPPLYALQPGSPAIDAGDNLDCPTTDQRGLRRPVDGDGNGTATCDIGAYEFGFQLDLPVLMR